MCLDKKKPCSVGEWNCVLNDNVEKYFVKFGFQPNLGT